MMTKYTYETKCRRCGRFNEYLTAVPRNWNESILRESELSKQPIVHSCSCSNRRTVQDVISFSKYENESDVDLGHGLCKVIGCKKFATKDYNGCGHWVCDRHYDKLNDEFDEEYR